MILLLAAALISSILAQEGPEERIDDAEFDKSVAQYGLDWTVLQPGEPLARAMDAKPGWRRLYRDRWAVVHARVGALESLPANAAPRLYARQIAVAFEPWAFVERKNTLPYPPLASTTASAR